MLDPTLGDETARRMRGQLAQGDWREAHQLLKGARNWDDRAFYVGVLAKWDGRPDWLDAWREQSGPASPVPLLVRGSHGIGWAWEARGTSVADKVDDQSWPAFAARLRDAERDLEEAARLDPEDPTPWALLVQSGVGLQLPRETLRARFEEARRRHRENRTAHHAFLSALTWKWGGSHQEMLTFAREAAAGAPAGSTLHGLIAWAHIERSLAFAMEGNPSAAADCLSSRATRAEVTAAWERLFGAPRLRAPRFEAQDRNVFAFCFWRGREFDRAKVELTAIGSRVTELPWAYVGDAEKTIERATYESFGSTEPELAREMSQLREEAVRSALDNHKVALDYSEASLRQVDVILDQIRQGLAAEKDEERRRKASAMLTAMYGSYVGEVVRRGHGGTWLRKVEGAEKSGYGILVGDRYGFPLLACALAIKKGDGESVSAYVRQWLTPEPPPGSATATPAATPSAPPVAPPAPGVTPIAVPPSVPPTGQAPPPTTALPAEDMQRLAENAVTDVAKSVGLTLDYSEASLAIVDRVLDLVRAQTAKMPVDKRREPASMTALKFGAYMGEVLRRELGGVWREGPESTPGIPALVLGSDSALTIPAVLGLLEDGAVGMGEGRVSTAVAYFSEVSARRERWLEQLLSGGAGPEAHIAAMTDDRALGETLRGLAASALVTAWTKWDLHLDFSEASLEGLESLLGLLHDNLEKEKAAPEQVRQMAMIWGTYLGEVLRRHLGGRWLNTEVKGQGNVLRLVIEGVEVYPLRKAEKRMLNGPGDNVRFYYHATTKLVRGELK